MHKFSLQSSSTRKSIKDFFFVVVVAHVCMDIFGTIKEHHPIYISNLFNSNYIQQKLNLPSSQFKFHFQLQKSLNIYIKLFSKEMIWNSSQSINISQSHHIDIHFTHKIFGQNKKNLSVVHQVCTPFTDLKKESKLIKLLLEFLIEYHLVYCCYADFQIREPSLKIDIWLITSK
eukprot:TRINITY_DN121_c0_g2_i1.p1 TRINITY_DN121_c0_g2~~TRINITY_DN121_c0_g2_i1.p1  ORF type:complete len:174 (+),score=12.74 TRINITY_DN121_c0_g2_i1:416-937(+)